MIKCITDLGWHLQISFDHMAGPYGPKGEYRQVVLALIDISPGGFEYFNDEEDLYLTGLSIHNPADLFDMDKGRKVAISLALAESDLSKEERADIWKAIHEMLAAEKAIHGLNEVAKYTERYGEAAFNEMLLNSIGDSLDTDNKKRRRSSVPA